MIRALASRLAQMLFVLWLVVTVVFVVIHLAPGDPTQHLALDPSLPPAARATQIERLGLDQPLHVQYRTYLSGLVVGDLGTSASLYPREVGEIVMQRLPRTIALLGSATLVAFAVGFVVGRSVAFRRGSGVERTTTVLAIFLYTVFPPWIALMMIWIFAFELGWFPSGRFLTPALWRDAPWAANQVFTAMFAHLTALVVAVVLVHVASARLNVPRARRVASIVGTTAVVGAFAGIWAAQPMRPYVLDIAWHTALPTVTLTLLAFGATTLLTRTSMLETLQEDYVLTARAKGLTERAVRDRHVARTALNPVVASLMLSLGAVVSGSIVFESVFSWPGLGLTFLDAAIRGDVPLAAGVLMAYGVVLLGLHLLADIIYAVLDPRIRP